MTRPKFLDLNRVRAEFENWRAQRKGRARIPENLWASAISLLDYYPFYRVCKELNLNAKQLRDRAEVSGKSAHKRSKDKRANKPSRQHYSSEPEFLVMTAGDLANNLPLSNNTSLANGSNNSCRIVLERVDGSRLSLNLPLQWQHIQSICASFFKV
jgi:hypothetical protein